MDFEKSIKLGKATGLVIAENLRQIKKLPDISDSYIGFGLLNDELLTLYTAIYLKPRDDADIRAKAVSLAATTIRFLTDCCEVE